MDKKTKGIDRRKFIGSIPAMATLSTGLMAQACQSNESQTTPAPNRMTDDISLQPIENVRIGFVGLGVRGSNHIRKLLNMQGCQIVCVCDIIPEKVKKIQKWSIEKGFPQPKGYAKDEVDYQRMCENEEFDLLITATPWELHASICIAGMENGKHAATEVPGCTSIDACWALVEASEKYQKHCILLENYCYFQEILAVDNMLRKGLFGEPMHVYAGYQKEAMYYQMTSDGNLTFSGEGHDNSYGNVYPTHHAGPSAKWMNVNRGDCFDYLVSMGCGNVAFNQYAKERFGPDHPLAKRTFNMADISNTMIMTKEGRTLHLILDTILPRPGRHYFRLQAERGIYENIERRLHIHNVSPGKYTGLESNPYANKRHWESIDNYLEEYDHPIWKKFHKDDLKEAGHAGADYVILRKLINGFNLGVYPDIDVYDLAAWSCLVEVSEVSARNRSKAVDIPDFTRGKWKQRKPLPILI